MTDGSDIWFDEAVAALLPDGAPRTWSVIVFFSALSFSGTARLSTCSHVDDRPRIRVCICDFVAFM